MKKIFLPLLLLTAVAVSAENLLTNSSFENSIPLKKSKWKVELFNEWTCNLNSGSAKGDIQLVQPGYKSKQALRVRTIGPSGFNSVSYKKEFPVTQGQKVTASVMFKGKGNGYIRIYYIDKSGKRLKQYTMQGDHARKEFAALLVRFTVPAGVAKIRYSLETLRNDADIIFDDAKLEIESGDLLENDMLRVTFNPRLGGGIASFFWKEKKLRIHLFQDSCPGRRHGQLCHSCQPYSRRILQSAFCEEVKHQRYDVLRSTHCLRSLAGPCNDPYLHFAP